MKASKGIIAIVLIVIIGLVIASATMRVPDTNPGTPINTDTTTNTETQTQTTVTPPMESKEIIIGVEYVVRGLGEGFGDLGIPAVKPLPDSLTWDKMQKSSDDPIDFTITDRYVEEFQDNGFTHIVFGLKVSGNFLQDPWMIDETHPKTQAVDPGLYSHYGNWVRSLVERYDMDGVQDMPGLRYPVKHYEIGVEFSSYQPEPTDVYLKTLELGYKAAHDAYDEVIVGHSAFLVTPVFRGDPDPDEYEEAFAENILGTAGKGLEDIRMVLDRPDLFDVLNIHNLGWPYEIERIVKWLNYETQNRGYSKPIIISDTLPTSFAGFGPATKCEGDKLAILFPPASDEDRCRLAEYFQKLVDMDQEYIDWLRNFLAGDVVQRVVIAAEQGIELIDTAFTGDLPVATLAIFQAAAGNSGWGGMVDIEADLAQGGQTVVGKRAPYYALQQLQANIKGYASITRVETFEDLRLYKIEKNEAIFFVAWYGYRELYLPDDPTPKKTFQINVGEDSIIIEEMRTSSDVTRKSVTTADGILDLELTPEPIYIFED
jgi:hypothetical protein